MRLFQTLVLILCVFASTFVEAKDFKLTSPEVKPGSTLGSEQVYHGFGCVGGNRSPALKWTAGPKGTKSYAVTVYDPDAPTRSGWWHWVVYNIPSDVAELVAGAGDSSAKKLPVAVLQGRTDFGTHDFGGACLPQGDKPHRYIFTVYALKVEKIDVPSEASAAMIGFMINANKIKAARFTAKYGR